MDKGYTVSFGTVGKGDDSKKTKNSMAQSHAYQVMDRRQCGSLYLFKLRNPWRSEWFVSSKHSAATKACIGADYNELNDGYFWITDKQVMTDIANYEFSYLEYDWPVRFMKHLDSADSIITILINNPVVQDVFIQVDINNERATHCVSSTSSVMIDNNQKILQGGTGYKLYNALPAGPKTIILKMKWATGNTRRNMVIKTYAAQDVPFTMGGTAA